MTAKKDFWVLEDGHLRPQSKHWEESRTMADYLRLVALADDGLFNTKEQHEKSIRSHQPAHDR